MIVNDTGRPTGTVFASLAGDNYVTIKWGEVELRVDKAIVDCCRKSWQEVKSILTQAQIVEQREFALSAINRHIGETNRARPRKAKMDRLMSELVSWHVMQGDAS
jgi:hypothetical protein